VAKILITGVAGFIGFHLASKLSNTEDEIIGIDNLNSYYDLQLKHDRLKELRSNNFKFIKADITNQEAMKSIFEEHKFTKVIHLAAQAGIRYSFKHPQTYVNVNIVGTFNIFELCKTYNTEHVIYASSSSVYGDNCSEILSTDDQCESPMNMYAASKKSNELMAHSYASLNNMKITGLRFFTVYGPWGRPDMAPMIFAKAIHENETIKLFNNGDMYRDFTYIDDIIDGIILVLTKEFKGNYNIFNIGNSKPVHLKEFTQIMQDKFGKPVNIKNLPMQKGEVYKTYADITQMKEIFSFSPKVEIGAGVEKFIEWYKNYYIKTSA